MFEVTIMMTVFFLVGSLSLVELIIFQQLMKIHAPLPTTRFHAPYCNDTF